MHFKTLPREAATKCAWSSGQHTSAYVSIRQHTSAYVSIRHLAEGGCDEVRVEVRGYSMRLTIKKHQHI